MRWYPGIIWAGTLLLAAVSPSISAQQTKQPDYLHGSFDCRQDGRTFVAECRFVVKGLHLDSLYASVDGDVLIYARASGYLHPDFTANFDEAKLRYRFDGTIRKQLPSDDPLYFCGLEAVGTDDHGAVVRRDETQMVRTFGLGVNAVPGVGIGYFDGDFGRGLADEALAFSWEGEVFFSTDKIRVAVGTSQFGNWTKSNRKSFTEGIRLRSDYYPWGDRWYYPFLKGGLTRTTLTFRKGELAYDKAEFGLMAGAGVRTPFERLDYSFTTCLGGYHTAGLTFMLTRWGPNYLGTRYEITVHEKVTTYRIQAVFDGLDFDGPLLQLDRYNDRFFLLKGLAWVGCLPYLPLLPFM